MTDQTDQADHAEQELRYSRVRPDGMRGRYLAALLTGGHAPMGRRPCAGRD